MFSFLKKQQQNKTNKHTNKQTIIVFQKLFFMSLRTLFEYDFYGMSFLVFISVSLQAHSPKCYIGRQLTWFLCSSVHRYAVYSACT